MASSSSSAPTTPVAAAYVLHSPALANREGHVRSLEQLLSRVAASVRVVTTHEPHDVVGSVAQLVDLNPANLPASAEEFRPHVRNMQVRQLSSAAKHLEALRAVAAGAAGTGSTAFRLVVEDDCLFGDRAEDVLRAVCASAPPEVDVVFLGLPSPKAAPPPGGGAALDDLFSVFGVLPACDSYLVRPAAAERLAAAFLPMRFAANVHLTYLVKSAGLSARIAVPNAFVDGSKLGVFACTLDANSKLIWNQHFCQMEVLLRTSEAYGPEQRAQFEALLEAQPFKQHPDVLLLVAQHLERSGRHAEAAEAYERALAAYDANGCIVNNTSEVLRAYIGVHRHLQGGAPPTGVAPPTTQIAGTP